MWVHPDLVKGQQWTDVTNRKSKGKAKAYPCNVVYASSREAETDVPLLTDSEEETIILATELNAPHIVETRLGQSYLKIYDKMVANSPKPTPELTKQSPWRSKRSFDIPRLSRRTKQKDLQYLIALMS